MQVKTALILCAGLGKRLNPLTLTTPKPLLELNNVTMLENCINMLIYHILSRNLTKIKKACKYYN